MPVLFEQIEIKNQVLLIQFQFQKHKLKVDDGQVDGLSLDKYITVDIWSQIFLKLQSTIEKYKSNVKDKLTETVILMRRAQLELCVSWKEKRPFHKETAYLDYKNKNCDLCPYVMVVKVGMVSRIDTYRKQHSQESKTEKPTTKPSKQLCKSDSSETGDNRTSNGSSTVTTDDIADEYVPAAITKVDIDIPQYTPSTLSCQLDDEYLPSIPNANDVKSETFTYTPTKIQSNNFKTDVNRNKSKINELFGESESEDQPVNGPLRLLRSKSAQKSQPNLDEWISCKSKKNPTEHDKRIEFRKKRKLNDNIHVTNPMVQTSKDDDESAKLRKLAEECDKEDELNSMIVDRFINLKDITTVEIMATFPKHRHDLKKVFQKKAKIPDYCIAPTVKECDYLLINHELLDEKQQTSMYKKLRQEFDPQYGSQIEFTSNHENLIWKFILPEWALLIFMDKFNLTRQDAIIQIKNQDDARIRKESDNFLDSD